MLRYRILLILSLADQIYSRKFLLPLRESHFIKNRALSRPFHITKKKRMWINKSWNWISKATAFFPACNNCFIAPATNDIYYQQTARKYFTWNSNPRQFYLFFLLLIPRVSRSKYRCGIQRRSLLSVLAGKIRCATISLIQVYQVDRDNLMKGQCDI